MAGDGNVKVKAAKAAKEPKAKKEKSDKPKIKRAPSAFFIFSNEQRQSVKEANPDATFGGLGKLLGLAWGALDDKGKAVSICNFLVICVFNVSCFFCLFFL